MATRQMCCGSWCHAMQSRPLVTLLGEVSAKHLEPRECKCTEVNHERSTSAGWQSWSRVPRATRSVLHHLPGRRRPRGQAQNPLKKRHREGIIHQEDQRKKRKTSRKSSISNEFSINFNGFPIKFLGKSTVNSVNSHLSRTIGSTARRGRTRPRASRPSPWPVGPSGAPGHGAWRPPWRPRCRTQRRPSPAAPGWRRAG